MVEARAGLRVCLVRPPVITAPRSLSYYGAVPDLGLAYVAAALRELGAADQEIAFRLHIPEPVVQKLSLRVINTPDGIAPSKRGFEHLQGQTLSSSQAAAMNSVRSGEVGRICLELTRMLEQQLVDLDDPMVVDHLRRLAATIEGVLTSSAAQ